MDLVSIVIPTYNRDECLGRAIESALAQTYPAIEVVVVDDGSTDQTPAMMRSLDDDRITYVRQPHRGANAARNTGVDLANGELISFLDSDNELHEDHIEIAAGVLRDAEPTVAGVFTAYERRRDGELVSFKRVKDEAVTADTLRRRNAIGGFSATTFRADVFDRVGRLDESFPSAQDYEFYLRVADHYRFRGIDQCLLTKHAHHDSIGSDLDRKREGYRRLIDKHGDRLHPQRIAKQHQNLGMVYATNGELDEARRQFLDALAVYPLNLYTVYLLAATSLGHRTFDRLAGLPKSVYAHLNQRGIPGR